MATQLIQVLTFLNVGVGMEAALPHNLNAAGARLVPDLVQRDNADFAVVAVTATTATVRNDGTAPANLNLWLEHKHTIPRQLGSTNTKNLVPQPFIPAVGGGGGCNCPPLVQRLDGDGTQPPIAIDPDADIVHLVGASENPQEFTLGAATDDGHQIILFGNSATVDAPNIVGGTTTYTFPSVVGSSVPSAILVWDATAGFGGAWLEVD